MKIAFGFWGLTRSLKFTINSIKKNIFDQFKKKGIEYDIFLHTYYFEGLYSNKVNNIKNVQLDFDEYKLLNPDYFKIDNQDEIKKKINFNLYETKNKSSKIALPKNSHINFIMALYSKLQLVNLIKDSKNDYDYIIFLRPDVKFINKFNVNWFNLSKKVKILIPNFAHHKGYNDRFFIGNYKQGIVYGSAFNYLEEYAVHTRLKPEIFNKYIIDKKCRLNQKRTFIRFINLYFQRIRANGEIDKNDLKL